MSVWNDLPTEWVSCDSVLSLKSRLFMLTFSNCQPGAPMWYADAIGPRQVTLPARALPHSERYGVTENKIRNDTELI